MIETIAVDQDNNACDPDDAGISYFQHLEECEALIAAIDAELSDPAPWMEGSGALQFLPTPQQAKDGAASKVGQLGLLISTYQELPHLLHPHLSQLVTPLMNVFIRFLPTATVIWEWESHPAVQHEGDANLIITGALGQSFDSFDADAAKQPLHLIGHALYLITKTAGEKACTSYFPNEVSHFEDVFYALRWWSTDPRRQREWEVRHCLLLWMSNLVLVPFSMHLIDTQAAGGQVTSGDVAGTAAPPPPTETQGQIEYTPVVNMRPSQSLSLSDATLVAAVSFLIDSTKCKESAALLVARLLTRPDSKHHRDTFFRLADNVLQPSQKRYHGFLWEGLMASGKVSTLRGTVEEQLFPGILMAVAKTMKLAQRREVVRYAEPLIEHLTEGWWEEHVSVTLLSKLCVKVVQRLIMSMLPKRTASWKYYKASVAALSANLSGREEAAATATSTNQDEDDDNADDEDSIDGDESVLEMGITLLLEALGHKDTVVRWSAAKGVGRVCDRLPQTMATDVITAVFDLLNDEQEEQESAWHGAMLAIAELCRRGMLTKDRLTDAVECIEKGLRYDLAKGTYSVGSHVRDAAAYACWSMARAYDPNDLQPHVYKLGTALVVTSVLDRHVNVRRAASAAFQECVGRLGNFPHGIDLVTTMDFFALASLTNAYHVVAPQVAVFPLYQTALVKELVENKLQHWDRTVRVAAAVALERIASLDEAAARTEVFPALIQRVEDSIVGSRHGAVLGLAGLVRGLPPQGWTTEQLQALVSVIPRLDGARLFRSRGGEYVREACCELLEALALHRLPLPETVEVEKVSGGTRSVRTLGKIQSFLEETWSNIMDWLQLTAAKAFRSFAAAYYVSFQAGFHDKLLAKMMDSLKNEALPLLQRKGFLAAIRGIPQPLLLASPPPQAEAEEGSSDAPYFVKLIDAILPLISPSMVGDEPQSATADLLADPECRRNAVVSLAQLTLTLPLTDCPAATTAVYDRVLDALLAALRDFSTDNRGDVGSFVRVASLQHLAQVVQHCLQSSTGCSSDRLLMVLQSAVRLLFEKLDRSREAAGATLVALLAADEAVTSSLLAVWENGSSQSEGHVAEVKVLRDLVRQLHVPDSTAEQQEVVWRSPTVMASIGPRLLTEATELFGGAAADGLVVSAGDFTDHVRVPALQALQDAFQRGDSSAMLSHTVTSVGPRYEHVERVVVPLARVMDFLISQSLLVPSDHLSVVNFLRSELKHFSASVKVVLPLIPLLASLCRSPSDQAREDAWVLAVTMTASRYPKVRAVMAAELYSTFLSLPDVMKVDGLEAASELLMAVKWEGTDAVVIRSARNQLYGLLGVTPPAGLNTTAGPAQPKKPKRDIVAANYSDLVQEAGY